MNLDIHLHKGHMDALFVHHTIFSAILPEFLCTTAILGTALLLDGWL
jgi:hypothetical protein